MTRNPHVLLAAPLLLFLLLPATPAVTQQGDVAEPAGDVETEVPVVPPLESDEDALATVEEILADEANMLEGDYEYQPANRRDPFLPLIGNPDTGVDPPCTPKHDDDPSCVGIDGIRVTGIFLWPEPFAQVKAPDRTRSYILREGAELRDGRVVRITSNEVVFEQRVDDPMSFKPTRDVTKMLVPEPIG